MIKILIIDDDPGICHLLTKIVQNMGHESTFKRALEEGLNEANSNPYDLILLDLWLPDGNGLDILPELLQTPSSPEVIVITGHANLDSAEIALKSGVWDYIKKEDLPESLKLPLQCVARRRKALIQKKPFAVILSLTGIIGNGPLIRNCFDLVAQAANSPVNVLITGDTGTGKELFAKAIHANSARYQNRFVVVDCAALPDTLVESLLFGHVKGAFTGADRGQEGLIKEADKGTLFLDEVGELPLAVQKSFLRVLQERRFRPVGGKREIESDFRIIAATNRNLDEMVTTGKFRKDLLYRLKALLIHLPPLKERAEDIDDIVAYHVKKICTRYNTVSKGWSPDFLTTLKKCPWHGNIRELVHVLETAINAAPNDPILLPIHLPANIRLESMRLTIGNGIEKPDETVLKKSAPLISISYADMKKKIEKQYFKDLVYMTKGDIKQCCKISGVSRSRLYDILKKYDF